MRRKKNGEPYIHMCIACHAFICTKDNIYRIFVIYTSGQCNNAHCALQIRLALIDLHMQKYVMRGKRDTNVSICLRPFGQPNQAHTRSRSGIWSKFPVTPIFVPSMGHSLDHVCIFLSSRATGFLFGFVNAVFMYGYGY